MLKINSKTKILFLLLSVMLYFIVVGMSAVLVPLILKANNISKTLIGFSDNIKIITGLLMLAILPKIASKMGIVATGIFSLILYGVSILLLPFYKNFFVWSILIFFFGAGFIIFRTMEETLANVIATNKNRAKIMGLVGTFMLVGLSFGPIITKIFSTSSYINYVIAFVFLMLSAGFFSFLKSFQGNVKPTASFNLWKYLKEMPMVFFSKFILEFVVQSIFVFSIIYTIETTNNTSENAGLYITCFSLSGFLNVFVGRFVDRFNDKNKLMIFGVFFIFISMFLFPLTLKINIILTYILFFLFGLCGSSLVFLSTMYILNSSYEKKDLVSANSALTFSDAIAMVSSSFFTGLSMQYFGANGFFVPIVVLFLIYILFVLNCNYAKNKP